MDYQESIDWLYATQQFGIKLGLDAPRRLLREYLAMPKAETKVIHIAGTNGKGSTSAMIDSLARHCGRKTGLFTSPHLIDYRERIRVNGEMIEQQTVADSLTELRELVASWPHHPTFFELTLAVAMKHFRQRECEIIILETGMGGKLDATTAVPADLHLITPIALDHCEYLGDTLDKVAEEKAGIITSSNPVISASQPALAHAVIEEKASEMRAPIEFITEPINGYALSLKGPHQRENAALALHACHALQLPISVDCVRQALANTSWPGRFEPITDSAGRHFILDGAHNPQAAGTLVDTWLEEFPNQPATIIFSAVEDKDISSVLEVINKIASHIHLCPIDSPRALSTEQLAAACPADSNTSQHPNLSAALAAAATENPDSPVLICGSLFLIGQAKAELTGTATRPSSQ